MRGVEENGLAVYKGIPFAAPPVGDLRWRSPQPAAAWSGVLKADAFAPVCPQPDGANAALGMPVLPSSEDCLYLNVWTPVSLFSSRRAPVMVWIYGGGFASGGTGLPSYSGEHLARKGVVVVSIAYRLGAFGFLAHPDLSAESGHGSGDFGLLDQIAALKWVKANIAAFGGDPDNVTIFGESAGGISVSMLAASPLAKDLFQRAISESGGSFAPSRTANQGGTNTPSLAVAERQGATFIQGLGAASIADARKIPADTILKAGGRFWPVMDGYVIPGDQYELYKAGQYNDTPILIGTNSDEGALFPQAPNAAAYVANVRAAYGDYADKILAAYPGDTDAEALQLRPRPLPRDRFRLAHLGLGEAAIEDRQGQGLRLLFRPPAALSGPATPEGLGRGARVGDRLCAGNLRRLARHELDGRRSGAFRPDPVLLGELRHERRPERRRPARLAGLHRNERSRHALRSGPARGSHAQPGQAKGDGWLLCVGRAQAVAGPQARHKHSRTPSN